MKSFFIISVVFLINIHDSFGQQINPKIKELYADKTEQIAQNEPDRIKALNDLLDNRIKIIESPIVGEDKFIKLSSVGLLNKYNPNLKRDVIFDINSFNPLKYNLNFFSLKTEIYRIDNTDYILTIEPQSIK